MRIMAVLGLTVISLGLMACGGETNDELNEATQAVNSSTTGAAYVYPIYNPTSGIVHGTGVAVTGTQMLVNLFHSQLSPSSPVPFNNGLWNTGGFWVHDRHMSVNVPFAYDDCEIKWYSTPYGTVPIWAVCTTLVPWGELSYLTSYTSATPGSYTYAHGAGKTCNANTMGANAAVWDATQTDKSYVTRDVLSGITKVGQTGNLCTPFGTQSECYDYSTGVTCMWGDDGSMHFKYNSYLVGSGFGNTGAAWATSSIMSWISAQRDLGGGGPGGPGDF